MLRCLREWLCWHQWKCVGRWECRIDPPPSPPRSVFSAWLCFRCGKQRWEQWDIYG